MRKIALKSPTLLAFALGAAHLSAAGVDVPGSARVAAVRFQAGREPIRFDLAWDNGSNRTLTVQPKDTALIINSNVGKKYPTSQAGFEFKGLGVVDFVRPNVTIYRKAIREGYTNDWGKLPEIYGQEYRLEFKPRPLLN